MIWKAYFPEEGESIEDSMTLSPPVWKSLNDAEDAAQFACEYDYGRRDGWERGSDTRFSIVIVDRQGIETHWRGRHEPSVNHIVEMAENGETT